MREANIAVGLDIGTSKVCIAVAEQDEFGKLNVLAEGFVHSDGIRRAAVVNINKTVAAIKAAADEVERESSIVIHGVNVALSGAHVHCIQSSSEISINQSGIVNESDVHRFLEKARANIQNLDINHEIIHVIPQEFIVDDQDKLLDPIGMAGMTMRGSVYIVVGLKTKIRNIRQCIERAGMKIIGLTFKPVALGMAVIKEREMRGGVAVIDIGGGTTEVTLYLGSAIHYSEVITVGANDVTLDIAHALQIDEEVAERLKKQHGCADGRISSEAEDIVIEAGEGYSQKTVQKSFLNLVIEARMMEILELVRDALMLSGYYEAVNAGAILTGGGSLLQGAVELAQNVLGLDVRKGYAEGVSGGVNRRGAVNSPMDATALGLVTYVYRDNLSVNQSFATAAAVPGIAASKPAAPQKSEDVPALQEKSVAWKKVVDGLQEWWEKL